MLFKCNEGNKLKPLPDTKRNEAENSDITVVIKTVSLSYLKLILGSELRNWTSQHGWYSYQPKNICIKVSETLLFGTMCALEIERVIFLIAWCLSDSVASGFLQGGSVYRCCAAHNIRSEVVSEDTNLKTLLTVLACHF